MKIINNASIDFEYVLPDGVESASATSNDVETENLTQSFTKVKASNKTYLNEGETAVQTITMTNNSDTTIKNPFFTDVLSAGGSFVEGSVKVDNVAQPTYDIATGFNLDEIAPSGTRVVEYQIMANNTKTQDFIENTASLAYQVDDSIAGTVDFEENSNTVQIDLISTKLTIVKTVDKGYAIKGDTINYTITITNTGSSAIQDITFTDAIPEGTTFVAGSVTIDGVSQSAYNPATGFALPTMSVGDERVVKFAVTVN